jgi:hypothetical protein
MAAEAPPRRSLFRRLLPLLIVLLVIGLLTTQRLRDPESSESELNPVVTADFPANVEAGSVHTATITIENPAASDIENLFVSFATLGTAGGKDLSTPIVGGVPSGRESPVVSIDPQPSATGGGVRFGFGELSGEEEMTVEFELRVPETTGPAANSIVVYDGAVPERSGGSKIETIVES